MAVNAVQYTDDLVFVQRIGEPTRTYSQSLDAFIDDTKCLHVEQYRAQYVGLAAWDLWMYFIHKAVHQHLPFEFRVTIFELLPPSFRLLSSSDSICDSVKPGVDVYFWCFVMDLLTFFWTLLFYAQMAEKSLSGPDSLISGLTTSRFSGNMVFILFLEMMFMVADRVVYLTNTMLLKLLCQWLNVIWFHYLIFISWPSATDAPLYLNGFLVVFYLFRLTYWLLSCVQIAHGYPTFVRTHSRMSLDFTFFYWCFYSVYLAIPFVYEMRTILEWVCIPTTLQLADLMKLEDIYGQVFIVKCLNLMYREKRSRGEPQPLVKKFFAGGCVFIAIIAFLIVPLLLFSTASPATTNNAVEQCSLSVTIANIQDFGDLNLLSLTNYNLETASAQELPIGLRSYFDASSQVAQALKFESDADSVFTVPSVLRDRVSTILSCFNQTTAECEQTLRGTQIVMEFRFTRHGPDSNNPIQGRVVLNEADLSQAEAYLLSQVLNTSNTQLASFVCPSNYSQWLRLPPTADVSVYPVDGNPQQAVNLTLVTNVDQFESYWSVLTLDGATLQWEGLTFILVSDNFVSSSVLSLIGSYSVVAFYAIVVYSFAQILRLAYGDQVKQIIFQDLQNVDYILRIVTAVKLARTQRSFHLEELLYRKLIRIYRDPKLIVQLTKRQNEDVLRKNAFDGFQDTSFNDPSQFGYSIRHEKDNLLRRRKKDEITEEPPPIQSTIDK